MIVTADKDSLLNLLSWHGKGSPSGLVRVSVEEDGAPLVIESAPRDNNGWQASTLPVEDSKAGEATFSVLRLIAQKRLGRKTTSMTLELHGNTITSRLGRSSAASPAVTDIPGFWRPDAATAGGDPFRVLAEVDKSDLAWLLRVGESMRSTDLMHPTHAATLLIEEGTVRIHSTDGYRMGFGEIASLIEGEPVEHFISPSDLASALSIMGDAQTVELIEANGHLGVRGSESVMVRSSLAAGPPPMKTLLETARETLQASTPLRLPVADLSDALGGIGLGKNGSTLIEVREDFIVVSNADSASDIEGKTKVEVEALVPEGASGASFKFNAANASAVLKQFRTQDLMLTRNPRMAVFSEPGGSDGQTPFIANISLVQ